ncbi:septum formation initiator family protein [Candidatus Curtissbacteria bacterium]|nr:septum formation initiator family protein [Candidatus Curtissbacteria bacterium]
MGLVNGSIMLTMTMSKIEWSIPTGRIMFRRVKIYIVRRNLLLVLGIIAGVLLVISSTKRLFTFRTTTQKVQEAQVRLEALQEENKRLQGEREFTKSEEFREREIRDKLGLAKEGEAVVILPKENDENSKSVFRRKRDSTRNSKPRPNWQKWWDLFFGG